MRRLTVLFPLGSVSVPRCLGAGLGSPTLFNWHEGAVSPCAFFLARHSASACDPARAEFGEPCGDTLGCAGVQLSRSANAARLATYPAWQPDGGDYHNRNQLEALMATTPTQAVPSGDAPYRLTEAEHTRLYLVYQALDLFNQLASTQEVGTPDRLVTLERESLACFAVLLRDQLDHALHFSGRTL
jgi:hypothetical protein